MTAQLTDITALCDSLLEPGCFNDYCPNGLQVEGAPEIHKIITGVTASQALIDAAIEHGAQAILVHHGYFWKGDNPVVTGMMRNRLKSLMSHDISLLAYHLPLDAHPLLGNNVRLAEVLGLKVSGGLQAGNARSIGLFGELARPMSGAAFADHLQHTLGRAPLHIPGPAAHINTLAWCTGAAQGMIEQALSLGADAYLTGEVSEQTVHIARERGIHFFAAGHHATERYGIQALGEYLAGQLNVEHRFVDIDNPV